MDVAILSAKIQAETLRARDDSERHYNTFPERMVSICFVDLVGSSAARAALGPRHGYILSESLISLIKSVIRPYSDVRIIKEIGDEVLLIAESFRSILEIILLADNAASSLANVIGTDNFPFQIRSAIGFGAVKKINRINEDYIGTPIDQLSRIMAVKSSTSNIFVHENAISNNGDILSEYGESISISNPLQVHQSILKGFPNNIFYREIYANREKLLKFSSGFHSWTSNAL